LVISAAAAAGAAPLSATPGDLTVMRDRIVASLLPTGDDADHLMRSAKDVAALMTADHTWSDVDTTNAERNNWKLRTQLDRALLLAKAAALARRDGRPDPAIAQASVAALDYWIARDFKNPNWWWNEIGVPQLTGEAVLLLGPDCPPATRDGVVNLMKRSVWTKWTGQNLVWGVGNQVVRGIITSDPSLVAAAYDRLYEEIVITQKEGIQPDYSFHQHGAQFYSGGYGLGFANDVGRYIAFAWGTGCQAPPDKVEIYDHYMLDGQAWMTWGGLFDYSALGREIVRKGKVAVPTSWTDGPIVPVGRAYGLGHTAYLLSQLPVPRQHEYATWTGRLLGDASVKSLSGHRHFWCSDYTAHRRPEFLFSVKMFSTRLQNTELTNGEGRKSHHLGDGNTFLYRTGDEYRDIFPLWDWNKLPGTTAEQAASDEDLDKLLPGGNRARGKTDFVGGVSDGRYGATAMLLQRGHLSAKKSWFCFDEEIVCLGSSIYCDSANPVVTAVEQCFSKGPVSQGAENHWVHHNGVGYVFPSSQDVVLTNGPQSGAWADLGGGSSPERLTADVFSLWIDHGAHPDGSRYAYVLLPGSTAEATAAYLAHPRVEILAQTDAAHAVRHAELGITAAVFFAPGKVADIEADRPCIVLVRKDRLSVCDPTNRPALINVTVNGAPHAVQCPDGPMAGSSATVPLGK
jgi:chondroitin AC lyase